ncbi:hypothetical protein GTQ99_21645 [Kineococcus sp. T13]|uniref:hypothetical protein n=1 Tax=Kineococcus vitellinus TaxID=2696565 RepID=UPI0014120361|nr:hypothetical protein [Kineococcus vitellinus]NAZ77991.1 hypothetical protein [Kineococcus vitellinus]
MKPHPSAAGVMGYMACAALLTACSASSLSAGLEGPLLVSQGSWDAAMTAAIGGPLAEVGACIGIGESMVVWPDGVGWDEESQSLVLADGTRVALGSRVYGGGGSMPTSAINSLFDSQAAEGLRECEVEVGAEVMVFNVGGSVSSTPLP